MSADPRTDPPTPDPLRDVTTYDARRAEVASMIEEADRQDDHPMGPDGLADALMEIADGWYRAALAALPSAPDQRLREALAEIVSDSLAAATEGTDYAEAPEYSDEPGSPYVMRLTNEIAARLRGPA